MNPSCRAGTQYGVAERALLSLSAHRGAADEIAGWPGYAPTPLHWPSGLARSLDVDSIGYKDEGGRFGLGSFKALGGAYAVLCHVRRNVAESTGETPSSAELAAGQFADLTRDITVTTATDGNHGRSVAWGARMFGCRAVIYIPAVCSAEREAQIRGYGAEVVRTSHDYDGAVAQCIEDAAAQGRTVIADTSWDGNETAPREVTQGYTLMLEETLEQSPEGWIPTHVFVQGGVGALAAAVCGYLWELLGDAMPRVIVVEPDGAPCLFQSCLEGGPATVTVETHSVMAGLDCGTTSPLAWRMLEPGVFAFLTMPDDAVAPTMRLLADGPFGDRPVVSGESGVAGLAGFLCAWKDAAARETLGLQPESRILLFGTEGATDPAIYCTLVGRTPDDVLRQETIAS